MKLTKHKLHTITAALTLGTLSIGFSPAAMAVSTYDAAASLSLTLTGVTGTGGTGTTVTSGWSVVAIGDDFGGAVTSVVGDATAGGTTSVVDPVSMSISDSILQSSTAFGTATNGFSSTDALTNLEMSVTNFSGQALNFSFDYDIIATASATGDDAMADVLVELLGFGIVDILAEASANSISGPVSDDASVSGSFNFTLGAGNRQIFTGVAGGFVDSIGAASAVPVPAAVWLFGSGLLGLVGVARRKRA